MGECRWMSAGHLSLKVCKVISLLLVVFLVGILTACGSSETKKITEATNNAIQEAVAGDTAALAALYDTIWFTPEDFGVSWECFSENYLSTVSYAVEKVEKTATGYTAFVTMQTCNAEDLTTALGRSKNQALSNQDISASTSGNHVGFADQAFSDLLASQPLETKEVTFELYFSQVEKGSWTLLNEEVLLGSVLGGFDGRQAAA